MCDYQTIQKNTKNVIRNLNPTKNTIRNIKDDIKKTIRNIKDNMRNTKDGVNNTEQEPSCDDTLLEFRRTWRFLTGAGVLDHVFYEFL